MGDTFARGELVSGSLCYVLRNDSVLLLKRDKMPHRGLWSPPGGKLEFGEAPQECALREVREETGLSIAEPTLRAVVTVVDVAWPIHWLLFVFRAEYGGGELLRDSPEGELRWVELDGLDGYERPFADRETWPHVLGDGAIYQGKFVYDTPSNLTGQARYL